ncbi:MAG: methylmalonyl-CoA epimerase [Euryarchaeota archaeon]|nr:methylmalonyl-CoA epimerase [Euryarchaeota archaeon]
MRIDHIGIAVRSLASALKVYEAIGLRPEATEDVPTEGVRTAFLRVGDAHLELLEPLTSDGVIARFLAKRGEGFHHIALAVDDILVAMEQARKRGLAVIDEKPRTGARGRLVAFVHPKSTGGVLLEFAQYPRT